MKHKLLSILTGATLMAISLQGTGNAAEKIVIG